MPNVLLSTNTVGAEIRYSTDGNDVTEESTLYSGQFSVEAGATVKAKAFKTGMNPSAQSTLQSFQKLQTPTVSLSRNGSVINITLGNTVEGATYRYKVGSAPTSPTDGTAITGSATLDNASALTIYVVGWKTGTYNPSDTAMDSVEQYVPLTVPMVLPDGSVLFYDRGASYGEYHIDDSGYPVRIDGAVDDGSAGSQNWRYLICDQSDLDSTEKAWGSYGASESLSAPANQDVGAGLPNTNAMIAKYATNTSYWWKLIKEKRDSTSLKWFMPSKDELNLIYENRTVITGQGGDAFQSAAYWSSSEYDNDFAWYQHFSNGFQNHGLKLNSSHCRLLRRI